MKNTVISWAHHTINWWTGCTKVSAECRNCYAESIEKRAGKNFALRKPTAYAFQAARRYNEDAGLAGKRAIVFTNSMSDFFDPAMDEARADIWKAIAAAPNLYWLILTKRPHLIPERLPADWGHTGWENVWLGTTCGSTQRYRCEYTQQWMTPLDRVDVLRSIPARVRFVSAEPLLTDIAPRMTLDGIGWVAVGGESGREWRYADRHMRIEWAANLYRKCWERDVRFLFKQASQRFTERGINALALQLGKHTGDGVVPETCDLIRQYPRIADGQLMPFREPDTKQRFTLA